jgi:hypothetical protein
MTSPNKKTGTTWVLIILLVAGALVVFACLAFISVLSGWTGLKAISRLPTVVQEASPRQSEATPQPQTALSTPTREIEVKPETSQSALLVNLIGLVEVRDENGDWSAVQENAPLNVHQHVRTGKLSSVTVRFFDGSQTRLGPEAELSVDKLDAQVDGPRIISLTQVSGESDHQVAVSSHPDSRYEVDSPSGYGIARQARFSVFASPAGFVRFAVDEGEVEVTSFNATKLVMAGQLTVCAIGQVPSGPFFRMTGEGRVDVVGPSWRIAGSVFQTNDRTFTTGNPQVGDWVGFDALVLLDGTRIVNRIYQLEQGQKNRFELRGKVDAIRPADWQISGRSVMVDESTLLDAGIQPGDSVTIIGFIRPNAGLLASRIRQSVDSSSLGFEFTGAVQAIAEDAWTVSDAMLSMNADTQIGAGITRGAVVRAQGQVQPDGAWLAQSISLAEVDRREFSVVGQLESVNPVRLAGTQTDMVGEIPADMSVAAGDQVRVTGRILEDGSWSVLNLRRLENVTSNEFYLWGAVNQTDPWMVSGVPLTSAENINLQGKVNVSRSVRVRGVVLPDGTLVAEEIAGLDQRQGCLSLTSVVRQISANKIVLFDWQSIRLGGGTVIQGELKEASVVRAAGCVAEDGTFTVANVVVIAQMDALPEIKP